MKTQIPEKLKNLQNILEKNGHHFAGEEIYAIDRNISALVDVIVNFENKKHKKNRKENY